MNFFWRFPKNLPKAVNKVWLRGDRGQTCPAEKENKENAFCKAQLATRNCGCIARLKEPCCAIGTPLDFWLHTDGRWPAYAEGLTR